MSFNYSVVYELSRLASQETGILSMASLRPGKYVRVFVALSSPDEDARDRVVQDTCDLVHKVCKDIKLASCDSPRNIQSYDDALDSVLNAGALVAYIGGRNFEAGAAIAIAEGRIDVIYLCEVSKVAYSRVPKPDDQHFLVTFHDENPQEIVSPLRANLLYIFSRRNLGQAAVEEGWPETVHQKMRSDLAREVPHWYRFPVDEPITVQEWKDRGRQQRLPGFNL